MAWKTQLLVLLKYSFTSFLVSYSIISIIIEALLPALQADKSLLVLYFQGFIVIVFYRSLYINKFDMIKIKDIRVIGKPKISKTELFKKDIFFESAFITAYLFFITFSSPKIMQKLEIM